ncbi:hypothetical protein EJV47_04155 [Hymenobacter gummosus]|uniref:Uncharacterized protein n=1 Tax=Hymenobacter gummosus TaxID=1776032 RepID=A0A3S0IQR6_9BACT|nr:hypothetical protein [Hymenobacter gummosus]RTQ52227.1 hypothetical protein EJV47_04155 [Hymenobacter gummosus]
MRVLSGSGLVVGRLRWDEWLLLGGYAAVVSWPEWPAGPEQQPAGDTSGLVSLALVGAVVGATMLVFSPGTRFRNVYFSAGWLVISGWLAVRSQALALEPLALFGLYHAVRWHYWRRNRRELVPGSVSRAGYEKDYYRLEKRRGTSEDIRYTKFLFRAGLLLFFLLLWLCIRRLP